MPPLIPSPSPDSWQSLDELAATAEFQRWVGREFPENASSWDDEPSRRKFLSLMGASLALAGVTGCTRQPAEMILPYVTPPEELIPGKPVQYATAALVNGFAEGVLVESHLGRPTKVEGNPNHPINAGAASPIAQASVLGLYDPDRAQPLQQRGQVRSWSEFRNSLNTILEEQRAKRGAGLRFLSETILSPSLAAMRDELQTAFPDCRWHCYEPAGLHSARTASQAVFGRASHTGYRLEQADVIVALDSDFLCCGPGYLRHAREVASGRRDEARMKRLYSVETTMTATGGKADHRIAMSPTQLELFARQLARAFGLQAPGPDSSVNEAWMNALTRDLRDHSGRSAVIPGEEASPVVHVLSHLMNHALGNDGKTIVHHDPLEFDSTDQLASLRSLVEDMQNGGVDVLVVIGGNPAYNSPADLPFRSTLSRARHVLHLSEHFDETSAVSEWHIPQTHFFETWSDARAFDGTVTILQPLIAPLYDGKSSLEFLAAFTNEPDRTAHGIVRAFWSRTHGGADFETWWRRSVHDGFITGSGLPVLDLVPSPAAASMPPPSSSGGLELSFRTDPYIFDGRYANNAWLQELPRPMTKLTWGNALHVGVAQAQRLQLASNDVVELRSDHSVLQVPVWISPGQPEDSVTLHLGFGRTHAGRAGNGAGVNAFELRRASELWSLHGLEIHATGQSSPLASTQNHFSMEGRPLAISQRAGQAAEKPENPPPQLNIYPNWNYTGYAWGMAIDLSACINCNACVVACQSENNIPVVGKEQVLARRAMHWLRIDTYFSGPPSNPSAVYQPLPCMHCENAPCEVVCPVQATSHDSEGLNQMVYNRCVGTRYCSNNCPYKVRRFNFLLYSDWETESLKLQRNPDVTVRSRGVMEKCTYCVQRIREAHIAADKEDRAIRDGEVRTACQQTCPTSAIVFGNINDPQSAVSTLKANKRNYSLLGELNTRPRTTYLTDLRNPNPALER